MTRMLFFEQESSKSPAAATEAAAAAEQVKMQWQATRDKQYNTNNKFKASTEITH